MAHTAKLGTNYTGVQMSPKDSKLMLDAANHWYPDVPGDDSDLGEARSLRNGEADRVGSVPVPGSAKGMLKSTFDMIKGKHPEVLVDKLGERLAFERNGVRLYDAMLAKVHGQEQPPATDLIGTLEHLRGEEHEHMLIVAEAIETLGGDPTAQTPCADVSAVMASGIVQVLTDPRTNVAQGLNALLTAELADNAAWEMLIELADNAGHSDIATRFKHCKQQEDDHLLKIRTLLRRAMIDDIR